jgi:hypothetical protein
VLHWITGSEQQEDRERRIDAEDHMQIGRLLGLPRPPLGQRRFKMKIPKIKISPNAVSTGRKRGDGDAAVIGSSNRERRLTGCLRA